MSHEVFILTQLGRTLSDVNKRSLCTEFWLKDPATMEEQFAFCPEALANTLEVADRCDVQFNFTDDKGRPIYYLPKFPIPPGEDAKTPEEYLAVAARRGLAKRFEAPSFKPTRERPDWTELKKAYEQRNEDEIGMIQKTGFSGYFLIVSDYLAARAALAELEKPRGVTLLERVSERTLDPFNAAGELFRS